MLFLEPSSPAQQYPPGKAPRRLLHRHEIGGGRGYENERRPDAAQNRGPPRLPRGLNTEHRGGAKSALVFSYWLINHRSWQKRSGLLLANNWLRRYLQPHRRDSTGEAGNRVPVTMKRLRLAAVNRAATLRVVAGEREQASHGCLGPGHEPWLARCA